MHKVISDEQLPQIDSDLPWTKIKPENRLTNYQHHSHWAVKLAIFTAFSHSLNICVNWIASYVICVHTYSVLNFCYLRALFFELKHFYI